MKEGKIFPLKKREKPAEPKKIDETKFSPFLFLFLIGGIILVNIQIIIGVILFVLFIGGIIVYLIENAKYPNELENYNKNLIKYEEELIS